MDYDAIVIGTGFGGTIAATRLAAKGKKTLMLERGTWWITPQKLGKDPAPQKKKIQQWAKEQQPPHPVQYWPRPDHRKGLLDLFASIRHPANRDGLYQYSFFKQAHILTASGVGGGSLIYSNVTLRPQAEVLQDLGLELGDPEFSAAYQWMEDFRGKLNRIVTKIPLPGRDVSNLGADDYLYLDRSRVLRDAGPVAAQKLGVKIDWSPLPLSIVEYDPDRGPASDAAKVNTFCERQGRCMLGCLPAARHTLNKTLYSRLLSDPTKGVALQPMAEVRDIGGIPGGYQVNFRDHREERDRTVTAPMVFLAGGTLGSTEILLRSRDRGGVVPSNVLGSHFSTNGDFGAFAVGTTLPVYSTRGPINTCGLQLKIDGTHLTVEDCAIPAMFAGITSTALKVLDDLAKPGTFKAKMFKARMLLKWRFKRLPDLRDFFPLLPDTHDPKSYETEAEMVSNVFFFNVMGVDDASGVFQLRHDRLDLDWPKPIADHPVFGTIERVLKELVGGMGGKYIPLPTWHGLANHKLIITHPLGGCPIGSSSADGVVDGSGRVFDGTKPSGSTDVLPGLFVIDGSTIPGALAANPTLTIAAQALKAVMNALP